MLSKFCLLLILCVAVVLCYTKPDKICKSGDDKCFTTVARDIFKTAILGDDKLDVPSLTPLHLEVVEGHLPSVKYTMSDSDSKGFEDMIINELNYIPPETLHFDCSLPVYEINGHYEVDGKLQNLSIRGKGKFFANTTNFHFLIDTTREIYERNGEKYLKLTDLKIKPELLGTLYLDMENLFDGNKELSEPTLKFMMENPKLVADLWQDPIMEANIYKIFENVNKFLEKMPVKDIFELRA